MTLTPADGSKEATALPLVEDAGCLGRAAVSSFPSESGPQVFTKGPAFKPAPEPILATGISPRVAGDAPALCKEMLPKGDNGQDPPPHTRLRAPRRAKIVPTAGIRSYPETCWGAEGDERWGPSRAGPQGAGGQVTPHAHSPERAARWRTVLRQVSARCKNRRLSYPLTR